MIAIGLFCGGPELNYAPISKAFRRIAIAISEVYDFGWVSTIPGLHVGFYVDGSAGPWDEVDGLAPARFSRKKKLLLVNVRVPKDVVNDFEKSFQFIVASLHEASAIAADTFARKGSKPFDLAKADALIDGTLQYFSDQVFRKRIDDQMAPGA